MVFPELVAPALGGTGLWLSTFIETVPLFLLSLGLFLVLELIRRRLFQAIGYPEIMSADTVTNPFPERPIRPLPKRRLRERLSPDVADAIEYPPLPSSTTPLFSYSCASKDEDLESTGIASRERGAVSVEGGYVARSIESDGDDASGRRTLVARSSWRATARSRQAPRQDASRAQNAQPPPSTDSSADGYDSFENTNNKKKRKIPTTGDLSLNGSHGMNDGAVASSPTSDFHGDGSGVATAYHGSGGFISSSPGISGPGRGRYGRSRTGRSPLRALSDASNNWAGRGGKFRPSQWAMQTGENSGIISNAIANAEKLPSQHGQENVSLLQQRQLSTKSSPASTQFTFTCDSQVPGNLTWPGPEHGTGLPPTHAAEPQWVQDRLVGKDMAPARTSGPNNMGQQAPKQGTGKKKSRRKLMNELQRQAQDRQREQAMKNYESPPKDGEDLYVCPYCEFEMLIGHKPRALLYDFEMKERKKRLEEERRRRLLDKAKARGRKGRKAKSAGKTSGVTDAQSSAGQQAPPMQPSHSQDTRSEGDEEEEYVDGSEDRSGDAPQPGVTTDLGQNTALAERSAKDDGGGHPGGGTGGEPGTT